MHINFLNLVYHSSNVRWGRVWWYQHTRPCPTLLGILALAIGACFCRH